MMNRIGFRINADPIENGFLCVIKYADVVRTCHCEDFDAVKALVDEVSEAWKIRSVELEAEGATVDDARQ